MSKSVFKVVAIYLVLFLITACHQNQKFTREKWFNGDDINFPLRDDILQDLINNHKLKGLTYREVKDSLGSPQDTGTLKLSYQIINTGHEYNPKHRPVYVKNLNFYFSKDSIVTHTEVYEHHNKK